MNFRLLLLTCASLLSLFACGPGTAPLSPTELTGKWEVVDLKIDSDYIDASPKFKEAVITGSMGMFYTFSDEKFLTITPRKGSEQFGEYTLEDDGHSLKHNSGGAESLSEIHSDNGNLYLKQYFDDVDGSTSSTTLVLRKR